MAYRMLRFKTIDPGAPEILEALKADAAPDPVHLSEHVYRVEDVACDTFPNLMDTLQAAGIPYDCCTTEPAVPDGPHWFSYRPLSNGGMFMYRGHGNEPEDLTVLADC